MKRSKRLSFTSQFVLAFGVLLLTANFLLGLIILNQSNQVIRSLINKNMMDLVNFASTVMDGDALASLQAEDVGTMSYHSMLEKLSMFQNGGDVRFIYAVRQAGEGRFVFILDPDPVEPAEFGEEIVVTEGLIRAWQGVSTVDDLPVADRWGSFYSAYSPVFDSGHRVAAVIGVDFDADWFENQVRQHTVVITIITGISALIGSVIIGVITRNVRKRFISLDDGLSALSASVDKLMGEIDVMSGKGPPKRQEAPPPADELEALGQKIQTMQTDMRRYMNYLQTKAYTDALTRVRNATAYHEMLLDVESEIRGQTAGFGVAVFDVNGLKQINDTYGHEYGDVIIRGAAASIAGAFGERHVYRTGGDEFVAVLRGPREAEMEARLIRVDQGIAEFNASDRPFDMILSISVGSAHFDPGRDTSYKEVYARADQNMYANKRDYHQSHEGFSKGQ